MRIYRKTKIENYKRREHSELKHLSNYRKKKITKKVSSSGERKIHMSKDGP